MAVNVSTVSYLLLTILIYSGVTIGYFLSNALKKETAEYKKTFFILGNVLLSLMLALIIYFINPLFVFTAISAFLLVLALLLTFKLKSVYIYPVLGLIFFWSSFSQNLLFFQTVLMFLYGLVSIPYELKKKQAYNINNMLWKLFFLVTALVPLGLKLLL